MELRPCHHDSPAKYATVVDALSVLPYGDIHGPVRAENVELMVKYRRDEVAEHGLPLRFSIGILHVDGCRTEVRDGDDPALDIPADQVGTAVSWTPAVPTKLEVAQALLNAVLVLELSPDLSLTRITSLAREAYELALRDLVGDRAGHVLLATTVHELPLQAAVNACR